MVRMFRKMAQDAFQVVLWVQGQGIKDMARIRKENTDKWYHTPSKGRGDGRSEEDQIRLAFKSAIEGNSSPSDPLNPIIIDMAQALNNDKYVGASDKDLIDQLVDILQLPYPRNTLSGKTLEYLSKAILLPEELGKLSARLKGQEMACGTCGRDLQSGEGVTIAADGKSRVLLCSGCRIPDFFACKCGLGLGELPDKWRKALGKGIIKCPTCRTGANGGSGVDGADVQIDQPVAVPLRAGVGGVIRDAVGPYRILRDRDRIRPAEVAAPMPMDPRLRDAAAPAPRGLRELGEQLYAAGRANRDYGVIRDGVGERDQQALAIEHRDWAGNRFPRAAIPAPEAVEAAPANDNMEWLDPLDDLLVLNDGDNG